MNWGHLCPHGRRADLHQLQPTGSLAAADGQGGRVCCVGGAPGWWLGTVVAGGGRSRAQAAPLRRACGRCRVARWRGHSAALLVWWIGTGADRWALARWGRWCVDVVRWLTSPGLHQVQPTGSREAADDSTGGAAMPLIVFDYFETSDAILTAQKWALSPTTENRHKKAEKGFTFRSKCLLKAVNMPPKMPCSSTIRTALFLHSFPPPCSFFVGTVGTNWKNARKSLSPLKKSVPTCTGDKRVLSGDSGDKFSLQDSF